MSSLRRVRRTLVGAGLVAGTLAAAAGCATGSGRGAAGWAENGGPPASGPPVLVGTASVPADSSRQPAAVVAARVLQAQGWPVASIDSTAGMLVSGWQYFEMPIRTSLTDGYCQNVMAIRFVVRRPSEHWDRAQVTAEAYLPQPAYSRRNGEAQAISDQNDALSRARGVLAAFHKAVAAEAEGAAAAQRAERELARTLDNGGLQRCNY